MVIVKVANENLAEVFNDVNKKINGIINEERNAIFEALNKSIAVSKEKYLKEVMIFLRDKEPHEPFDKTYTASDVLQITEN